MILAGESGNGISPMSERVRIGDRFVGVGEPCFVVAEIGINHNGDLELAEKLIDAAVAAGADAVKFQKRTIETVYSAAELERPRVSPFGETNGDLKRGLEFGRSEYERIDLHCRTAGIMWFASCWDEDSVDLIAEFEPPCFKIASACLTDVGLLRHHRKYRYPIILSTGMSTLKQIDEAVSTLGKDQLILMHSVSTYPASYEDLNLLAIRELGDRYGVPVGYSGHEVGLAASLAASVLGACAIERHLTLDRAMWGSDQAASVEPHGFARLVRDIRAVSVALGDGEKKLLPNELSVLKRLRRKG